MINKCIKVLTRRQLTRSNSTTFQNSANLEDRNEEATTIQLTNKLGLASLVFLSISNSVGSGKDE